MSLRRCLIGTGLMCALVFGGSGAMAQEDHSGHDHAKGQDADKGQEQAGEMSAEMQEWMALSTPAAEHENLKNAVGEWKATVKYWADPTGEPMVSPAKEVNTAVLGGRYIRSEFSGEFGGMPFSGLGYTGYDRIQKKYVSTWMDSMGTQIMVQLGDYDASTKTYTFEGELPAPSGGVVKSKMVDKITGPNSHVLTMYHQMPGQEGMPKVMEISYERIGKAAAMAD